MRSRNYIKVKKQAKRKQMQQNIALLHISK